jgi:phosphoribosyl-ATP pyrophosphohydrolase
MNIHNQKYSRETEKEFKLFWHSWTQKLTSESKNKIFEKFKLSKVEGKDLNMKEAPMNMVSEPTNLNYFTGKIMNMYLIPSHCTE